MPVNNHNERPTLGVLAGWQFYRTATNLSYLAPIFRGISRAAQDFGCNLLLGCGIGPSASPADPLRPAWPFLSPEHDFIPIGPWNTDGLIVASPLHSQGRSEYIQALRAAGHQVLFIGSGEPGPSIVADNSGGILEAMRHLMGHGHQQIAFIAGTLEDMGGDSGDRLRAYQFGCEKYALGQDSRLVAFGRHVFDGGYLAMRQILQSGVHFTAVLASNDESALGAMQALKETGRSIPLDVAVIGFDNRLEGAIHVPGLSSIHIPLFNIGYQAVDLLLRLIEGDAAIPGIIKVNTRLVIRESCGCSAEKIKPDISEANLASRLGEQGGIEALLVKTIEKTVLNQAHSITEDQAAYFCQHLVDSFRGCVQGRDRTEFRNTLVEILQRTEEAGDDTHIWQEAISILAQGWQTIFSESSTSASLVKDIVNDARLRISASMQHQHRQFVVNERWVASRLSLLTYRMLMALDEAQIYEILAKHLPNMDIHFAMLGLFGTQVSGPFTRCTLRDVILPERPLFHLDAQAFPPSGLFSKDHPFHLTLIPLIDQTGQTGFMVFGVEHLDLYGAIVQQVGGALNTARLYRQATEGRRLAEEANRIKSRFLSTISHELRTPLNLITGLSGILLEESDEGKSPLPGTVQRDIERIQAYAQHLGGLIGDVIDLATSEAGQLRLNLELMDLGDALRMVAESGRQLANDKGLLWQADIPETGPWVWGDRTRLRQVVLNLVNNAVKFTTRGDVSLIVETGETRVTISVRDTGLGISPEEQEAIFDEFRQSERSISLGYPGLGLGLAISKMLIEMHKGSIGVKSTGIEGEGATFYFSLPAVLPPPEQIQSIMRKPESEQTVLVLTAPEHISERLINLLKQRGLQVQIKSMMQSTDWSLVLLHSLPDAIVIDVSVDSDLSWGAYHTIKDSHLARGIPIMFFTSSPGGEAVLNLDYLTKPIKLAELKQTLDQYWLLVDPDHTVRTILVVDDDPNTLDLHARIIQSQSSSNRVLKARDGREALELLQNEMVDLVLLDLQMPGLGGFDVLEAMRESEKTRYIPVVVVTGKVLTELEMARLNQGVAAVLKKGLFSIDETIAHISAALERNRRLSLNAQRLVRQAMAYIHEHYTEQISRRDIAQHVSIAEDYLTYCFRQELNITPILYLQRFRVNQAKTILKTSPKTITEIALDVGFTDSGYFSRIFRREMGMSPEEFRSS